MSHPLTQTCSKYCPCRAAAQHACPPRPDRRLLGLPRRILATLALALMAGLAAPALAGEPSKQPMQGLDEQVQEIKSDVLGIAAELDRLEEKLLYPSDTQLAVFVSLAEGETLRLDSVEIQLDGEPVAHHIYSFKELEALQRGGVQRIYTGNVPTGEHGLEVSVAGKLPGGRDFSKTERFEFSKAVAPKIVALTLDGQGSDVRIQQRGR